MNKIIFKIKYIVLFIFLFNFGTFAKNICGENIWTGWVDIYYEESGYGAVPRISDETGLVINTYGRYAFDYKTNLVDLLKEINDEYFDRWISFGPGSEKLINEEYGLPIAFNKYFSNNKEKVINIQDKYIYDNYYSKIKNELSNVGISLDSNSEFIKGMVLSYTFKKIKHNLISQNINSSFANEIKTCYDSNNDKFINNLYLLMIDRFAENESEKKKIYKERNDCLNKIDDSEKINEGSERLVINSNNFSDKYALNITKESNPYDNFLYLDKFGEQQNLDWYDNVRNDVDYRDNFKISSGFLDVSAESSRGIKLEKYIEKVEDELVKQTINNGRGFIYLPQNSVKQDYSYLKFGQNNVAQGGGSISCLSMVINKLLNKKDEFMITPKNIINKIKEEKKNENFYYNTEKGGMENEIITDVCSFYSLNSSIISKDSINSILYNNGIIIARVGKSEFATEGNFIILSGYEVKDGNVCCYIIDPNIAHAQYLFNLYPIDYLKSISNVLFEIKL